MWKNKKAWKIYSQNKKLNITLVTERETCVQTKRKLAVQHQWLKHDYYFILVTKESATCFVDDKAEKIKAGQMLFVAPHQIYFELKPIKGIEFFKLTIDDEVLSFLQRPFSFLNNCFDSPVVTFDFQAGQRVQQVMKMLHSMLKHEDERPELILNYIYVLLSELEHSFVRKNGITPKAKINLEMFHRFRDLVDEMHRQQPSAASLAKKMNVSGDALNKTVSKFSGMSSKEYILRRILLEAKRLLFHGDCPVKELAYTLGFSDPNYLSRLFKKKEGINISAYIKKMRELSR